MAVNDIVMSAAGASGPATFVEDVFSCFLYTGTGASQTITNGMDLSGKGGLVWMKGRSGATANALYDTNRGATFDLASESNNAQSTQPTGLTSFNSSGFVIGALAKINTSAATYASWSFRKQPKFFDVVTYTGTSANTTIAHNLGSVPGCIIIKKSNDPTAWQVYHRSLANTEYLVLNTTAAKATGATRWNSTTPTSSVFSLGTDTTVNALGGTYVAYIFAHDAGGFGAAGTDNVISCGSVSGTGTTVWNSVNLGWEPQWIMIKRTDGIGGGTGQEWTIIDNMRFMGEPDSTPGSSTAPKRLYANSLDAEGDYELKLHPTSTGFNFSSVAGYTYIYMAIRRPMKTPTTGTEVFKPTTYTGNNAAQSINVGFAADLVINPSLNQGNNDQITSDRLRGFPQILITRSTGIEQNGGSNYVVSATNTNVNLGAAGLSVSGATYVDWAFRRAPGFFDVVCYTGTGSATTVTHNLAAVPELMIVKCRSTSYAWAVYSPAYGNSFWFKLNATDSLAFSSAMWNSTSPTSSVFTVGNANEVNNSGSTYVAYLFASCAGVSKVGFMQGNGSNQTINCGFTTGARFVLIKRTDSTGDWYVWDSARGIVAGNDPHLSLNTSADQVTTDDSVDAASSGFIVNQLAATNINVNAAQYIFLAIA